MQEHFYCQPSKTATFPRQPSLRAGFFPRNSHFDGGGRAGFAFIFNVFFYLLVHKYAMFALMTPRNSATGSPHSGTEPRPSCAGGNDFSLCPTIERQFPGAGTPVFAYRSSAIVRVQYAKAGRFWHLNCHKPYSCFKIHVFRRLLAWKKTFWRLSMLPLMM